MRCPQCNKFVSFDAETDPEVEMEVDELGMVTGTVRIVNTCADCGEELKETTFDLEVDLTAACEDHVNDEGEDKHSLEVEEESSERTERSKGRRVFYGSRVEVNVTCACDSNFTAVGEWSDDIQGSAMEELV